MNKPSLVEVIIIIAIILIIVFLRNRHIWLRKVWQQTDK